MRLFWRIQTNIRKCEKSVKKSLQFDDFYGIFGIEKDNARPYVRIPTYYSERSEESVPLRFVRREPWRTGCAPLPGVSAHRRTRNVRPYIRPRRVILSGAKNPFPSVSLDGNRGALNVRRYRAWVRVGGYEKYQRIYGVDIHSCGFFRMRACLVCLITQKIGGKWCKIIEISCFCENRN